MKMGTIASPWRYDAVACAAPRVAETPTARDSGPHKYLAKPCLAGRKVSWSSLRNAFIAP
jgi:hypothetical protein